MTENTNDIRTTINNGTTTVEFDLGPGCFGTDIRMRVSHSFDLAATDPGYGEAVNEVIKKTFLTSQAKIESISTRSRASVQALGNLGYVQVGQVQQAAGLVAGTPVSGSGAAAVQAVGAGAPVAGGDEWVSYPNRFGGDVYVTKSLQAYTTEQLEAACMAYAESLGLDPTKLKVWDERKSAQPGVGALSTTANVKIADPFVPENAALVQGNKKTIFRAHFRNYSSTPTFELDKHWKTLIGVGQLGTLAKQGGQPPAPPAPVAAPQPPAPPAPAAPAAVQEPLLEAPEPEENPFGGDDWTNF